ncbi:MAG: AAA family ATPase [Proteobacteria bacterium]|nr:AAA family ATPase [Pseudomonadota bacterium]
MIHTYIQALRDNIATVLKGQTDAVEMAVICFLASGHLLIEDVPGVGKTTLASAFAQSLGLSYRRLQFTSDILPSDILGVSIFDPKASEFVFHEGPIFTNILLADEINRAEPRAQSALLEAMFERQVSLDGVTRDLPDPFMVIATQNPVDFSGTFPLPDSQLDRFLFRISMGYPDEASEREILRSSARPAPLKSVLDAAKIQQLYEAVEAVHASDEIMDNVLRLVHKTRTSAMIIQGASTRAMRDLLQAAKARALVHKRDFVLPEDIQNLAVPALAHRIRLASSASADERAVIEALASAKG